MKFVNKLLFVLLISVIASAVTGCGNVITQTTEQNHINVTANQEQPDFSYQFDIQKIEGKTYKIGFKITNNGSRAVNITFPNTPVSYLYRINDTKENLLSNFGDDSGIYQDGILTALSTITIEPGTSFYRESFPYTKDNESVLTISNQVFFSCDGKGYSEIINGTF
ncbi:MAG: hypothetical protein DKM50_10640 [Candidatus Margulisiibacteriota bacterium]|nr:MAG: hypothetical protein A2X43_06965 [Candidatus Margulisbacteria bacterium GWD2_39_127]OGI02978.1 MAG: hypothetical protein A2X42_12870 [Candidatus Margulisbacteria bacterium GWF2_38_17]OGI09429.1 MAG: hypothetical protein A2X41_12375 [Candidatus Margulisbacteria bacterium GWE2_39_32]PZM78771.1 MAG: hypothetical protein DKM50_10640 [Candidatus Margulisiibacteriota bacterium]HAR63326.1 hypothetical protein [Candidatus Margulisiibacteriota bacterium]